MEINPGGNMGEIKSAFEKAMERAERLGRASPEELERLKYVPEGEKLAAKYLWNECPLAEELNKYEEKLRGLLMQGAQEVLLKNIDLPRNEALHRTSEKAMEGLRTLKKDGASLDKVYAKIANIFEHYQQQGAKQKQETYEALRRDFQARLQQALQQQGLPAGARVDVESQPQFQEQWRRVSAQLDSQYLQLLDEYKREIASIL
jgi:prophage DNA circulation protein